MATILSVASSEVLKTTRQLLLEQQGFSVCSALDLAEVESIGKNHKVDLAHGIILGRGRHGRERPQDGKDHRLAIRLHHQPPRGRVIAPAFMSGTRAASRRLD